MTSDEKQVVECHLHQKKHTNQGELAKEINEEVKSPLPRKDHNFCHLCCIKYNDYVSHIKSIHHKGKIKANQNIFNHIGTKLAMIKNHSKKINKTSHEDIACSINLASTKEESFSYIEATINEKPSKLENESESPDIKEKCRESSEKKENLPSTFDYSLQLTSRKRKFSDINKSIEECEFEMKSRREKRFKNVMKREKKGTFNKITSKLLELKNLINIKRNKL